jgi:hypothetical protein
MFNTKQYVVCALFAMATLCACTASQGQAVFNGTWRTDLTKTKFSEKPFIFYTSQGWFHCETCAPILVVQADGQDHAVTGHALDTFNVTLVDQRTIHLVGKKGGTIAFDQTATVSADGKTLTVKDTDYPMNGEKPVTSESTLRRDGKLPPGVHPTSGRWIPLKASASANGLLTTYKVNGNEITMTDPTGDSYTAKVDGSDAPVKGAYGWDTVSLKLINDHTIEETDKFNGKVVDVSTIAVAANGKTMTVVVTEKPSERVSTFVATKQ